MRIDRCSGRVARRRRGESERFGVVDFAMVMMILGAMLLTDYGPKTVAGTIGSVGNYAVSD